MNPTIASVTVAYNAAHVLPRQIDALLRQSLPLREIVVVDNASGDGTVGMLANRYPQVTVLRMKENLGAAGAWAAGLAYAVFERKYDWAWTFDDDSVPADDSLALLLRGLGALNGNNSEVGIIVPMPIHRETGTRYPPFLWRNGFVKPSSDYMRKRVWFADSVIVSGSLVRREVVQKIGLPRADFFMDFFDFEYSLRARAHGYKIAVLPEAELGHEIGNARMVRLGGHSRLWTNQPAYREYYFTRNLVYLAWWLYPNFQTKLYVLRFLASRAAQLLLFGEQKLTCIRRMIQGFCDGVRGKLGIRLRPGAGCPAESLRTNGIEAGKA